MKPDSTTSWTPARGDVVGWPFVWRDQGDRAPYERSCGLLRLPALPEDMVLVAFSNLNKLDASQPWVEVKWTGRDGVAKSSVVYPRNAEVNILPVRRLVEARDSEGKMVNWGGMDSHNTSLLERRLFGGIIAGTAQAMRGYRWDGSDNRSAVILRKSEEGGLKLVER